MTLKDWLLRIALGLLGLVVLLAIVLSGLYYRSVHDQRLHRASHQTMTYAQSLAAFQLIQAQEAALNLRPGCSSLLLTHGARTAGSVVMFHGYTLCPSQFAALAQYFYNRGYNVYVPRAPLHGLPDPKATKDLQAVDLTRYADNSVTLATGLGDEVGVIGHSGGGNLATWAAQYRADVVRRLLAISPFFQPSASQTNWWQQIALIVLYGHHLLPDQFKDNFSYHTLAQYIDITRNFPHNPPDAHLKSAALVLASDDTQVDKPLARQILAKVASANHVPLSDFETDPSLHLGHDIVTPNGPDTKGQADSLYLRYFALY